jgi:hypothetical protein
LIEQERNDQIVRLSETIAGIAELSESGRAAIHVLEREALQVEHATSLCARALPQQGPVDEFFFLGLFARLTGDHDRHHNY